jgi:predicted nucleic acid-binding OB-fold protein
MQRIPAPFQARADRAGDGDRTVQASRARAQTAAIIDLHENVYIGDAERDKIERVKRRIGYNELTNTPRVNSRLLSRSCERP